MSDVDNAWQKCAADRFDDEMNGNPLNLPQGMPNLDDFKDGYRAGAAASDERIKELEAFLRRLREWDQMNPPVTGDHAAWAASIDRLLKGGQP